MKFSGLLLIGKEERIAELIPTAKAAFQVLEGTAVRVNEDSNNRVWIERRGYLGRKYRQI